MTVMELHLRGRVAAGRRSAFDAFLEEAVPVYESPGGIRVRVLWNRAHPDDFIEVIEYADEDIYDVDQIRVESDARMRELLQRWRALLEGPPVIETFMVGSWR